MREFSVSLNIAAPPERIWSVLAEVERWPEWSPSIERLEPLSGAPLEPGARVLIHQPKLRPAVWTVTHSDPPRRFDWNTRQPGVEVMATHAIATAANGCTVTLTLRMRGWLSPLAAALTGALTRRYLDLEANGLKARCEAAATGTSS